MLDSVAIGCLVSLVLVIQVKELLYRLVRVSLLGSVDIWERNKELIRKRMDIGEHFTQEIIQSIVFIFLPLGERVHLTNRSITTNLLGTKDVFRCE